MSQIPTATPTLHPPTAVLGCDVGKDSIVTFHSGSGQSKTVRNRLTDLQALTAFLEEAPPRLKTSRITQPSKTPDNPQNALT